MKFVVVLFYYLFATVSFSQKQNPLTRSGKASGCANKYHNCLDKLIPTNGGAWRGSTLPDHVNSPSSPQQLRLPLNNSCGDFDGDYSLYEIAYHHQLHLWRAFHGKEKKEITDAEMEFIQDGGILWYNIGISNWANGAAGVLDEDYRQYATEIKKAAPHKIFVCLEHEADHRWDNTTHTPLDYVQMWARFQTIFLEEGVDNVVWAMDFSNQLMYYADDYYESPVLKLWPPAFTNATIDWLFFNIFLKPGHVKNWGDMAYQILVMMDMFDTFSADPTLEHYDFTSIPWGVGAWGLNYKQTADDQIRSLTRAKKLVDLESMNRLQAWNYYDSREACINSSLLNAYESYLDAERFKLSDL